MEIKDLIREIDQFASDRDWNQFHTPKNLASSISIEAAELLECFQWNDPEISEVIENDGLLESVKEEIADVMIYSLRMCSILNLDAIYEICKKLEQNKKKYPVDVSRGRSTKYDKRGSR